MAQQQTTVFFFNEKGNREFIITENQQEVFAKIAWCIENKRAATVKVNGYVEGRVALGANGWVYNDFTKNWLIK